MSPRKKKADKDETKAISPMEETRALSPMEETRAIKEEEIGGDGSENPEDLGASPGSRILAQFLALLLGGLLSAFAFAVARYSNNFATPSSLLTFIFASCLGLSVMPFVYAIPFRISPKGLLPLGVLCLLACGTLQFALLPFLSFAAKKSHHHIVLYLLGGLYVSLFVFCLMRYTVPETKFWTNLFPLFLTPLAVMGVTFLPTASEFFLDGSPSFEALLWLPAFLSIPLMVTLFWQFGFSREVTPLGNPFRYYVQGVTIFVVILILGGILTSFMISRALPRDVKNLPGKVLPSKELVKAFSQEDYFYLLGEKEKADKKGEKTREQTLYTYHSDKGELKIKRTISLEGLKGRVLWAWQDRILVWGSVYAAPKGGTSPVYFPLALYLLEQKGPDSPLIYHSKFDFEGDTKDYNLDSTVVGIMDGKYMAVLHSPLSLKGNERIDTWLQIFDLNDEKNQWKHQIKIYPDKAPVMAMAGGNLYMTSSLGIERVNLSELKQVVNPAKATLLINYGEAPEKYLGPQNIDWSVSHLSVDAEGKYFLVSLTTDKVLLGGTVVYQLVDKAGKGSSSLTEGVAIDKILQPISRTGNGYHFRSRGSSRWMTFVGDRVVASVWDEIEIFSWKDLLEPQGM